MTSEGDRITVRVPMGLKQRLDKQIKDEKLFYSRSELIRHLLQNFLTDERRRKSR